MRFSGGFPDSRGLFHRGIGVFRSPPRLWSPSIISTGWFYVSWNSSTENHVSPHTRIHRIFYCGKNLAHKFKWVKYFEHLDFPHPTFSEMLWKDWMAIWPVCRTTKPRFSSWIFQHQRATMTPEGYTINPSLFHYIPSGWWYTYPSEKYEFVSWDHEIPNCFWSSSFKIPWFQSPPSSFPLIISTFLGWNSIKSSFLGKLS